MTKANRPALLFSGSSNPELAKAIAHSADIPEGRMRIGKFPDGEISLEILDSVRGKQVFVVQSVALQPNEFLMEFLIIVDALRRASAQSVIAVIPYFGYCRQDRKDKPRVPITAKLIANLQAEAGVNRLMTMDLHAEQVQGFFDIPVDHLYARPLLVEAVKRDGFENGVVVAPDIGSVKIARAFANDLAVANDLTVDFVIVDKHRLSATQVEAAHLIGDVKGKDVLLADDMCTTGATLWSAAKACHEKGAKRIRAAVTHGLFVGRAAELLAETPIERIYVTDTVPFNAEIRKLKSLCPISSASLFGQAVKCTLSNESIASFNR